MIRLLQNWKNAHQLELLVLAIILMIVIIITLRRKFAEKKVYKCSMLISGLYIAGIFYITVFSRKRGQVLEYNHEIFWSYRAALVDGGYLEEIGLNILLFVPLGVIWGSLIKEGKKYFYLLIVIFGGVLSACIEFLQYKWKCGFSEIDDVISNFFGIILGIIIWNLVHRQIKKDEKRT